MGYNTANSFSDICVPVSVSWYFCMASMSIINVNEYFLVATAQLHSKSRSGFCLVFDTDVNAR
jgi:hypothetical protein